MVIISWLLCKKILQQSKSKKVLQYPVLKFHKNLLNFKIN